jgi:hypothetical protein
MGNLNFTHEQLKLIFNSVRRYQIEKCSVGGQDYELCDSVLNVFYPFVYTQSKEK